jgi:hypothetical protein
VNRDRRHALVVEQVGLLVLANSAETRARITRLAATKKVLVNADAACWSPCVTAPGPPIFSTSEGSCLEAIAAPARGWSVRWLVRMTDIVATPTELAICWLMLSRVDPRATSWLVSVRRAVVKIGIIVPPMPRPMRNSQPVMTHFDVSASIWERPNIPTMMVVMPNGTMRPTGTRSTR